MREKRIGKIRHWILFFTVVIMAVLGVFTALQAEPEPRNVREKGSSVNQWDTGWHYQADDGTEKTCEVPSQIKIRGGKIILRQTIPEFSEEEKYLGFLNHYQQVEIYVDGVSRYRYMEQQTGTFHGMLGNNFCMTRLGREDAGKEITVIFSGFYREGLVQVPVICLDSRESMLLDIRVRECPRIIFCVVLLVLSAGMFLLWLLLRVREAVHVSSVFYAWIFILVSAVWILTDSKFMVFLSPWPRLICLISFYAFYMIPIPMLSFIREVCQRRSAMLDWMKTILAGNVLVQSLVYLMGGRKLMQMLPITHILYVAAMICSVIYMVKELRSSKAQYARIFLGGVFFLIVMAVVSLVSFYTGVGSRYAMYYQLGLLGFVCALLRMTVRQVNEILEDRTGDRILEEQIGRAHV